jgi:hypothetical protein
LALRGKLLVQFTYGDKIASVGKRLKSKLFDIPGIHIITFTGNWSFGLK